MRRLGSVRRLLLLPTLGTLTICSTLAGVLRAQVTVSGNGVGASNGMTLTEGTNISAVSGSETLWADSTDGRLKVTNHGVSTQFDLALWPCRLSPAGIVVAATTTTLGVYQETCPAGLTFVPPLLTVGSAGSTTGQIAFANSANSFTITLQPTTSPALGASRTYTIPDGGGSSKIGLTSGTLTNGNYASWDANGTAKDSGVKAGPYSIPWFTAPNAENSSTITFGSSTAKETLWGVVLTFPLTTTQVIYNVSTPDNSAHVYGLGVLDSSGNVVLHFNATAGSTVMTTGVHTVSWVESPATLQPGKYYLVATTNCSTSCAFLTGTNNNALTFLNGSAVTITTGGTVQAVTPPADSYDWGGTIPSWAIR